MTLELIGDSISVGTYPVTRSLPADMVGLLSTPEQVAQLLEGWS